MEGALAFVMLVFCLQPSPVRDSKHIIAMSRPPLIWLLAMPMALFVTIRLLTATNAQVFLVAYVFLNINGWQLKSSEAEAVNAVVDLAADKIDEAGFSIWLKNKSVTLTEKK